MPIYEYRCESCGNQFEELKKGFEEADSVCPACAQPAHRLISHSSFVLKGSGWYVTDYKKSNESKASAETSDAKVAGTSDNGSKKAADTAAS